MGITDSQVKTAMLIRLSPGRWTAPEWMIYAQPPRLVVLAARSTHSAFGSLTSWNASCAA